MRKIAMSLVILMLVSCFLTVPSLAQEDLSKDVIKVTRLKAKAITQNDKLKGFHNYAEYDSVYHYNDPNNGRVVGIVYDEETEAYVKNAWVENLELGFKVKTDQQGRFEINNLPDGTYTWIVRAPEYKGSTFASFPVNSILGASIYRFALSPKRSINSNLKLQKEAHHDHTSKHNIHDEISLQSTHADWPVIINFSVKYNDIIYHPEMDEYLYYVVASELWSPDSSLYSGISSAALLQGFKAQAVTARTYADYITRIYDKHDGYDLCSTTCCQVYNPYYTNQMTIDAVDGTTNQMLLVIYNWSTYDYIFVEAVFSASCLGNTKDNEDVWGSNPISYLRGVVCPYDLRPTLDSGHNVGLCQDGAIGYAKYGYNYIQILNHYFTGTTVKICHPQAR